MQFVSVKISENPWLKNELKIYEKSQIAK